MGAIHGGLGLLFLDRFIFASVPCMPTSVALADRENPTSASPMADDFGPSLDCCHFF